MEHRSRSRRSRRSRSSTSPSSPSVSGGLPSWLAIGGLLAGLLALLASESPLLANTTRLLLVQAGSGGLLLVLAFCGVFTQGLSKELRGGISMLVGGFLLWSVFATLIAPHRRFALIELFRVLDGVAVYFLAAYGLWRPRQARQALLGLVAMVAALCLYDFLQIGEAGGSIGLRGNVFGTHENYGSLVLLLLPLVLACAVSQEIDERLRTAALIATPVLGGGLLISLTRSAWIGGAVAFVVLMILFAKFGPHRRETPPTRRRFGVELLGSPTLMIFIGLVALVIMGGMATALLERSQSFTSALEEGSLTDRFHKWSGASRMASEKPLTGWGLGSSLVMQGRWTHQGDEMADVLTNGTGHQNIAHNFYTQWAADAGGMGLVLYVAVIALFLIQAVRALPRLRGDPLAKVLLMGCIATVIGASVDAIGSPAYNFHGVSCVLWFFIGIGVNLLRTTDQDTAPQPARALVGVALAMGVLVALIILGPGAWARLKGKTLPRGQLRLNVTPEGNASPGSQVAWIAEFRDETGKAISTFPGTTWVVQASQKTLSEAQASLVRPKQKDTFANATLSLKMPRTNDRITVKVQYWDNYSRWYEASASVDLLDNTK